MHRTETKAQANTLYRLALVCLAAASLFSLTAAAFATAGNDDAEYVDSVYSWGIWALELEPASGPQAAAGKPLNDRSRSLKFRPNDNAAFTARSIPVGLPVSAAPTAPTPVAPAAPVLPPPVPMGPPGFTSGGPTTADPRN